MASLTRRTVLQYAGATTVLGLEADPSAARSSGQRLAAWRFLSDAEAAFVAAACDRIIPPDPPGPGAVEVGCVAFIDGQLAGAFGGGARLYQQGPFREGLQEQGYQLPYTPAELYRLAIAAIDRRLFAERGAAGFAGLAPEAQDELLAQLHGGEGGFGPWAAPFAEMLVKNTVQGYFADPIYGGNRGMAAWRMIGFPGAYAQFVELVDEHDAVFDRPPMSIAQSVFHGAH